MNEVKKCLLQMEKYEFLWFKICYTRISEEESFTERDEIETIIRS